MNRFSISTVSVIVTAVALTGCGETSQDEDCQNKGQSMSFVMKPGPGGKSGGSVSRPAPRVNPPKVNKPAKQGSSSGSGKAKAPKIHIDDEGCD